jgi:hypothetical protein
VWGVKLGADMQYYTQESKLGLGLGIGFANSFASGAANVSSKSGAIITYTIANAQNIPVLLSYNWRLGQRSRIFLQSGYSVALNNPYKIGSTVGLTQEELDVFNFTLKGLAPGGLIAGLGLSFGLN